MRRRLSGLSKLTLALALVTAASCGGGGNDSPTSPTPTPTPTPTGDGSGTTITITSSGVSPKTLTVSPGSRVTFVNNDVRQHDIFSDPHPTHGSCPAIDQVGFIAQGQSKVSGNLTTVGSCTYHDHDLPNNTALQGTIRVQ
ncbi:MAG: hypothetical protein LC791_14510 [Acidobacteria bacterium]|nr:hypothetical protein [Acidobacteriota bacterium]